jgi:hypothetical protein
MIITLFESTSKAYIHNEQQQVGDMPWSDIVEALSMHRNVANKEDGDLFNLAEFKKIGDETALLGRKKVFKNGEWTGEYIHFPNTVRRCRDNIVSISGLVLDFDKDYTVDRAIDTFDGIEYILYTTFNHTFDNHRFRVVIPFIQQLWVDDIPKKMQSIKDTFIGVDDSSFSASQSFYFHSGNNDPLVYHNKGYLIDPYKDFTDGPITQKAITQTVINTEPVDLPIDYKQRLYDALLSCRGLRYPHALTLVAICKSNGLSYDQFNTICNHISDSDSTLIKDKSSRVSLWNSDYARITKDKRDKFINDHNGRWPDKILTVQQAVRQLNRRITIY